MNSNSNLFSKITENKRLVYGEILRNFYIIYSINYTFKNTDCRPKYQIGKGIFSNLKNVDTYVIHGYIVVYMSESRHWYACDS